MTQSTQRKCDASPDPESCWMVGFLSKSRCSNTIQSTMRATWAGACTLTSYSFGVLVFSSRAKRSTFAQRLVVSLYFCSVQLPQNNRLKDARGWLCDWWKGYQRPGWNAPGRPGSLCTSPEVTLGLKLVNSPHLGYHVRLGMPSFSISLRAVI